VRWRREVIAPGSARAVGSGTRALSTAPPGDAAPRGAPRMRVSLDLSFVAPGLAVGARVDPEDLPELAGMGILRVVDVRVEATPDERLMLRHGITLLHLPTQDRCAVSQTMLDEAARWSSNQLLAGEQVLVHCQHGIGRSALVALSVMVSMGYAPMAALQQAKDAREMISPSPEQLEAFREFCRRHDAAVPSLESLMIVAYRHLTAGAVGTGGPA
jgi:protein-tyrosine phosphatase